MELSEKIELNKQLRSYTGDTSFVLSLQIPNKTSKNVDRVEFGGKITSSFLFGEWLKKSQTLVGAKDDLKAEFVAMAQKTKKLLKAAEKGMYYEALKVLTKGSSITAAYGPGSATPKGKALFANNHTVYSTG
jgi:hypothetical protein